MERVNEKEKQYRQGDHGPKYLFRGPNIEWGIISFKPGQSLGAHYHEKVEETFFFLEGRPQILVNEKPYRVEEGDAFRLSPLERHDIVNDTSSAIKVLFIKAPYLPEDKIAVA